MGAVRPATRRLHTEAVDTRWCSCPASAKQAHTGVRLIARSKPTRQGIEPLKSAPSMIRRISSTYQRHCQRQSATAAGSRISGALLRAMTKLAWNFL